jgi:hypothetical protein
VKGSYALSQLIASNSKPFTDGQFIKERLIQTAKIMCPDKVNYFENNIFTQNTVVERVDGISNNLRIELCNISKQFDVATRKKLNTWYANL